MTAWFGISRATLYELNMTSGACLPACLPSSFSSFFYPATKASGREKGREAAAAAAAARRSIVRTILRVTLLAICGNQILTGKEEEEVSFLFTLYVGVTVLVSQYFRRLDLLSLLLLLSFVLSECKRNIFLLLACLRSLVFPFFPLRSGEKKKFFITYYLALRFVRRWLSSSVLWSFYATYVISPLPFPFKPSLACCT